MRPHAYTHAQVSKRQVLLLQEEPLQRTSTLNPTASGLAAKERRVLTSMFFRQDK
jgi:hypothetical protein